MVRFIKLLVFILVAVAVVFLSIANRHSVTVSLDPFSRAAPEFFFSAPLFLVLFGAVAMGVIIGGIAAWWAQHGKRSELRRSKREIRALKAETDKLRTNYPPRHPALPASDKAA